MVDHRRQRVHYIVQESASRAEHHRQLGHNPARLVTNVQDPRSDTDLDSASVSGYAEDTTRAHLRLKCTVHATFGLRQASHITHGDREAAARYEGGSALE
jgi:hypothetical protein